VGKIGIPDAILLKPGKLSPRERDVVRQHTVIGSRILGGGGSAIVAMAAQIARSHHERWDGKGYPDQLVAEEIPIEARITTVADVFDALRSKRPYRDEWALNLCLDEIRRQAGTQFDPVVVNAFLSGRCYEGYAVEGGASQDAEVAPTPVHESVMTAAARIATTGEHVERIAHSESTALLDVIA
jgi:HD-GYP domain-containing protein (c-di-GMP phosphodiesterase class II)